MSDERQAGYDEGWAAGKDAYDKLFQETIDAHGRLVDRNASLESQNQTLRERNAELERVLANLGVQLNAGGSGDPAGGEVE
jgi:hypothetical protein